MGGRNLAEVTSAVFAILESLSPAERRRVVSATFALLGDDAAMQLTKRFGAFDTNNHSANRRSLGNNLSGSRHAGFELPQPGLRSAAALVKQMAVPRGREKSPA